MNFHYGENIYLIDFCYFIKKVMFFITRSSSSTLSCQNQTSQKGATLHSPFTLLSTLCAATLPSFSSRFRSATRQSRKQPVAICFHPKQSFLLFASGLANSPFLPLLSSQPLRKPPLHRYLISLLLNFLLSFLCFILKCFLLFFFPLFSRSKLLSTFTRIFSIMQLSVYVGAFLWFGFVCYMRSMVHGFWILLKHLARLCDQLNGLKFCFRSNRFRNVVFLHEKIDCYTFYLLIRFPFLYVIRRLQL